MEKHSLLKRQIQRYLGAESGWPPALRSFVETINRTYHEADADRIMLERSLELSSQELLQANSEMRAMFTAFPDIFFCIDSAGTILHCNASSPMGFYRPPQMLIGKKIQDIPIPTVSQEFEKALGKVRRDRTTSSLEYEINIAGAGGHYEARLLPMGESQVGVFIRDITDRKKAEEALRFSQFAIDHIGEGAYWIDSDARILYVNEQACTYLEYTRDELLGMTIIDIDPLFDKEQWERHWGDVKRRKAFTIETEHRAKSGKIMPVEISVNYVEFNGREYNFAFSRDISHRQRLERAARQSEKMSAVGQLAAGVAHEINNPLGVILGFAQSARKKIQDGDALALPIKSIEREALRCKNLVQNLLSFSRQNKTQMEEFDFNEIILKTLSIIEAQAKVKSIEVFNELGAVPFFLGDKNQMQQVIINLCSNAIDAMPQGGEIRVRTRSSGANPECKIVLEVEDNGSGIPREVQNKIFDPFFTTKEAGQGTGLGLSLVYEIIQGHKGSIELKSQIGQGTTFAIFLPVQTGPEIGT